jgi:hypothetical protein
MRSFPADKRKEVVGNEIYFATAGALFFLVPILFFVPCKGYAFNPQPEPPGKAKNLSVNNINP